MQSKEKTKLIAKLNDQFRTTFVGGSVLVTDGIQSLGPETVREILSAVRRFSDFTEENDPYGEHDFGSINIREETIFFKLDYYDPAKEAGSEDPSDPAMTSRVLTILLANEY